jgi:fructoselysine transporter
MPLVVSNFHNGLFIWAWIFGAVTALIDGMIWSELGAKYPLAGGTYNFHRIAFGEKGGKADEFPVRVANQHTGATGNGIGRNRFCTVS